MTRRRLPVMVAVAQVSLAIFLWWYAPLQLDRALKAEKAKYPPNQQINLWMNFPWHNEPALADRISWAMNFPADVVAGLFNFGFPRPLYRTGVWRLSVKDLVFFISTGFLWYWVTSILVRRKTKRDSSKLLGVPRVALLSSGFLFALALGAVALDGLISVSSPPGYRQAAFFGLLWSLGLGAYFIWKLKSELIPGNG